MRMSEQVLKTRAETARQLLAGGTKSSFEEDLVADHDWEWIYDDNNDQEEPQNASSISRNRTATEDFPQSESRPVIGAKHGRFEIHVGDAVLLKADRNEPWVALLNGFVEDELEGEKFASFQWFSSPREIRNTAKRRTDALPNEIYATANFDENALDTIIGKATVLSPGKFQAKFPTGKVPRQASEFGKVFVCKRGCNTRTATYTEEFTWEDVYRDAGDLAPLRDRVEKETKATRKRKTEPKMRTKDLDDFVLDDEEDDSGPKTPSKRRKLDLARTPKSASKARTPGKFTTPTHRRMITKKPLEFTPLGTRILSPQHFSSPFQLARSQLHVSSVPSALPCREREFSQVYNYLESAITAGTGSCIYISGTPGTGKTATVREVVSSLSAAVEAEELDDFIFVEINGMKVTDPHQSYSLLWEALTGDRLSPTHALSLLEREFSSPSPRRVPCVVLMDELDQLVTKNQSVMYNFFNWPGLRHSRLIVLAVANTMDLPERTLSNKISSRLGLTRITFSGYTHDQLIKIIESRLSGVPGNIVEPDAVQFASRKVAQVSGDARRALDICRRAVEIAESEVVPTAPGAVAEDDDNENDENRPPDTPSKKPRSSNTTFSILPKQAPTGGRVTIATIQRAIREATSSPLQRYLRALPLSCKILLAAILARVRRTGVAECVMGDVIEEAAKLAGMSGVPGVRDFLLCAGSGRGAGLDVGDEGTKVGARGRVAGRKAPGRTARVVAMGAAAVEMMEAGVLMVEGGGVGGGRRGGERTARVRLNVGEGEVKLALKGDEEVVGMGFSS